MTRLMDIYVACSELRQRYLRKCAPNIGMAPRKLQVRRLLYKGTFLLSSFPKKDMGFCLNVDDVRLMIALGLLLCERDGLMITILFVSLVREWAVELVGRPFFYFAVFCFRFEIRRRCFLRNVRKYSTKQYHQTLNDAGEKSREEGWWSGGYPWGSKEEIDGSKSGVDGWPGKC